MATAILLARKNAGADALDALVASGIRVVAVVEDVDSTRPDERPVERCAAAHAVPVVTLERLDTRADYVISYLFRRRVPPAVLALADVLPLNFHPAPLPDFRGLGGYNVAILEGRSEWGVSAHVMVDDIDAGDVVDERRFPIAPDDTALSLDRRTQAALLALFRDVVREIATGRPLLRRPQGAGRYISRSDFLRLRHIEPGDPPDLIARKIRAFWYPPHPGAAVLIGGTEYTLVDETLLRALARELPS